MNVGKASFNTIMIEAEAFVIEAEDMENGGVKIIDRRNSFHGLVAEFIRRAIAEGRFHAGSRQPGGEAVGIVITTTRTLLEGGHTAKFGTEYDEGVLE